MELFELLIKYKHLPVIPHVLESDISDVTNLIKITPEDNLYKVEAKSEFSRFTSAISSEVILDSNFQLKEAQCGCLEHFRKKQCVHTTLLYALALKLLCPENFQIQYDKFKWVDLKEKQELILTQLTSDLRANASYFKKIHLTPEISFEGNCYFLSLRIGYDKEYVIKNISEFIYEMENNIYYSYGQKLAFIHSYEVLDDASKELYNLLTSVAHEDSFKNIKIKRGHVLSILEIYHDSGIYFARENEKLKYFLIEELRDIPLILDQHALFIEQPQKTKKLICGVNYAYFIGEEKIFSYHFQKRNEAVIFRALFKCQSEGLLIEANETDFISNLLPIIKKDIIIKDMFYDAYSLPSVKISSYFQYSKGKIINIPVVEVEDKYKETSYVRQIQDSYLKCLEAFGFESIDKKIYALDSLDLQYAFLTEDISVLKNYGEVYFDDSIKRIVLKKSNRVHIQISYNVGLLDFKFDGKALTLEEIEAMLIAYRQKKHFVKLKNDIIIKIKEEDAKELNNFLEDFNISIKDIHKKTTKPLNYLLKLVDGLEDSIQYDDNIYSMIQEIQNFKTNHFQPKEEFMNILRPYQLEGFRWLKTLAKFGFGGILADDMGLGKTLEIIAFLASDDVEGPSLIVCPMSLVYNWEAECSKWNYHNPVYLVMGGAQERENIIRSIDEKKKAIYITSYDSLRRDIDLYSMSFRTIIADEAQFIKNQNALKSAAIKQIKSTLRFALTGTPIENGLADLWSIFDYLMPGYLASYAHFKTRYESLIMQEDTETLTLLKKRVHPFILRRTKQEVLHELPDKLEEIYYCKMEPQQEEVYKMFVEQIKTDIQTSGTHILSLLTRLRQVCISPQLIYEDSIASAKLSLALELTQRAISSCHRILLFSQFASIFPILGNMFEKENISYQILDGKTSAKRRIELVDNFNNSSDIKVFMISLKAGGTGLNLTGADMVIHLDPWWNISAENQATDRAYRIGQTKNVHVLKLVCKETIEEKVLKLQELKKELANSIISCQEDKISLSKEDILELID